MSVLFAGAIPGAAQVPPLTITSTSPLPPATQGGYYSFTFQANGGTPPYTWGGTGLPPGLSLNSATGVMSGTPSSAASYSLTISVTDARGQITRKTFALTVSPPPVRVTTTSLPDTTVGVDYKAGLSAADGTPPYSWSIAAGSLPPGLSLASNGAISGKATTAGTFSFTAQVNDSAKGFAQARLSILVRAGLTITNNGPFPLNPGQAAQIDFDATGGDGKYTWSLVGGQLPDGLLLTASTGVVSGSPTKEGSFDATLRVADSSGASATKSFTFQVGTGLTISTPAQLPNATAGTAYSQTFTAASGTPPYTWSIPAAEVPPGLALDGAKGILSGTLPSSGTFNFTVTVKDAANKTTLKTFTLIVGASTAALQVSSLEITFRGFAGGDSPSPQFLTVTSSTGFPIPFSGRLDGCTAGSARPAWLQARALKSVTPARIQLIADSTSLPAGRYEACGTITANDKDTLIRILLILTEQASKLDVQPDSLRFSGTPQTLAQNIQALLIRNSGGGGSRPFRARSKKSSSWLSLNPTTGLIGPNSPVLMRVTAAAGTLRRGVYFDAIVFQSDNQTLEVPVLLLLGAAGPVIGLSQSGIRFDARSLNGFANQKNLNILNLGDGTLNWKADIVAAQPWLSLPNAAGQATAGQPSRLDLVAAPGTLSPGPYYALVRISDPQAANSPQYVVGVLNLADSATIAALPDPSPSGLFFVANQSNTPQSQPIRLFTSSLTSQDFDSSASADDGGDWLSVSPARGVTYTSNPAMLTVTVRTLNLRPGVYTGDITMRLSGLAVRTTNVTLIVPKVGSSIAANTKSGERALAGCAPESMIVTHTGLVNSFGAPAGWPTPLVVRLSDDCGDPVTNAQVVATFSNGDAAIPLRLTNPQTGLYSGTWSPTSTSNQVTVTAVATSPSLGRASREIIGAVSAARAPQLERNSTLNAWNAEINGPIAPGTWVSIFGSDLAPAAAQPNTLPFPTTLDGTTVVVGGVEAPLNYISPGQINALLPAELAPNQEYAVVVAANGGFALPDSIVTTNVRPGVFPFLPNKLILAQHLDYSSITSESPAKPGEIFTMYLLGMGETSPKVATGQPAPSASPFAPVVTQPEVRIGGTLAQIFYAGLTPGSVGLYQVTAKVPDDAPDGQLTVTVTQGETSANEVVIPVKR